MIYPLICQCLPYYYISMAKKYHNRVLSLRDFPKTISLIISTASTTSNSLTRQWSLKNAKHLRVCPCDHANRSHVALLLVLLMVKLTTLKHNIPKFSRATRAFNTSKLLFYKGAHFRDHCLVRELLHCRGS